MNPSAYLISTIVALVIHLVTNHRMLFSRVPLIEPRANRACRAFLWGVVFFLTDLSWGLAATLNVPRAMVVCTDAFYVGIFVLAILGTVFTATYTSRKDFAVRVLRALCYTIFAVSLVLLALNPTRHGVFTVGPDCSFTPGPWRAFILCFYGGIYLLGALLMLRSSILEWGELRKRNLVTMSYRLAIAVAFVVHADYPDVPCVTLGCLLGICILNIFVNRLAHERLVADLRAQVQSEQAQRDQARAAGAANEELLATVLRSAYDIYLRINLDTGISETVFDEGADWQPGRRQPRRNYRSLYRWMWHALSPAYRPLFEEGFALASLRRRRGQAGVLVHESLPLKVKDVWYTFDIEVVGAKDDGHLLNILVRNITDEVEAQRRAEIERAAADTREAMLRDVVESLFGYILTVDLATMTYKLTPGSGMEASVAYLARSNTMAWALAAKLTNLNEADRPQLMETFGEDALRAASTRIGRGFYRTIEYLALIQGRQVWEEMSAYFGVDEAGRKVLVILVRDVTAAHERLDAQREADRQANEARSLFFSSVSHDIRTPLNAIIGFSELLERGIEDAAERARYIKTIRASGKMLARLINDILDLTKLESGKMEILREPTDVTAVANEVVEAFAVIRAGKPICFHAETAQMPRVMVDPHRLRQVLYNLLSNAFKYTDRGSILLRTTWDGATGTLALSVADTGRGIPAEDLDRVLQPFVQVADRNHRDGTGLGLAICQRLVHYMGGKLSVESTFGVGSTFTMTLHHVAVAEASEAPEACEAVPSAPALPAAETPPVRTVRRVLLVDDTPVNLLVLKSMLARCGVTDVVTAADGKEAFERLLGEEKVDAVLTDLWMPEMDGEALVIAVRDTPALSSLPVYLVTADVEAVPRATEQGFSGVLLKPITLEGVQQLLRNV